MKKQNRSDAALGIFVTPDRIEAVLLRSSGARFEAVGRFSRPRARKGELVGAGSLATVLPGLKGNEDADFSIQIGDGTGSASQMFLSSELAGLGADPSPGGMSGGAQQGRPIPFVQQLREILAECHNLGYDKPKVAFCVGSPDVSYVELFVAQDHIDAAAGKKWSFPLKTDARKTAPGVDRRRLLELLAAQRPGGYEEARVTFLPMVPLQGQRRYLAVVPESIEPVSPTLSLMAQQYRTLAPSARMLDAEVPLYVVLARKVLAPGELEHTAIVRISSEDTLTLFLNGRNLRHFERLRSLTTYDPPETVCSRVLLQQDEQKIGEVHHVLVLSEAHQETFQDALRTFYPNAEVTSMQHALLADGLLEAEAESLRSSSVPAIGVGLNVLEAWERDDDFGAVNLLPKKLRRQPRRSFAFAWHTLAMLVVLFGVTFFFTLRYAQKQAEIDRSRQELQLLNMPDPTMGSAAALQARVDSLRNVYVQYTRALHVLDSLLVGSDQWSRTLEKTAQATRDLSGVWFEDWQPTGSSIRISGNAMSRSRVAQLANRLEASIEGTAFEEVNEVRIHPFTMVAPRPIAMPRVAEYLKDAVEIDAGLSGMSPSEASLQRETPQESP